MGVGRTRKRCPWFGGYGVLLLMCGDHGDRGGSGNAIQPLRRRGVASTETNAGGGSGRQFNRPLDQADTSNMRKIGLALVLAAALGTAACSAQGATSNVATLDGAATRACDEVQQISRATVSA